MDCGTRSRTLLALYDPDSSCWRMSQLSLLDDPASTSSSLVLPASGSMLSGRVYARPTSAHPTAATGGSSSPVLPTPMTADLPVRRVRAVGGASLSSEFVRDLLPTPAVNDMGRGKTPDEWDEWTDEMKARHGNGNGHGKSLEIEAQRLLPTPRASDGPKGGPGQTGDGLQPAVRRMARAESADASRGTTPQEATATDATAGDAAPATARPAAGSLLPTPRATRGGSSTERRRCSRRRARRTGWEATSGAVGRGDELLLPGVAKELGRLLPTPRVASDRASRAALTKQGHWSAPSLAQAVELAQGILPREYESWDEIQGWHGATTPPPSNDGQPSPDEQPPPPPTTQDD